MERVGIYTTSDRLGVIYDSLGGRFVDVKDPNAVPASLALASWQNAGFDSCIIDDDAVTDKDQMEEDLLEFAATATSPAVRVIFLAGLSRTATDPYLFQLVSKADIKDLVVPSVGHSVATTLPARLSSPATIMDVSAWKTEDKTKLKRKKKRGGPLGVLDRKLDERAQRKIAEEVSDTAAIEPGITAIDPQPAVQTTTQPHTFGNCPVCGASIYTQTQVVCGECGAALYEQPAVETQQPSFEQGAQLEAELILQPSQDQYVADTNTQEATNFVGEETYAMEGTTEIQSTGAAQEQGQTEETAGPSVFEGAYSQTLMAQPVPELSDSGRSNGEVEVNTPTAPCIISVGAVKRGIGCTHLACALALELAAKQVSTSLAIYNMETFYAMRAAIAPGKTSDVGGRFSLGDVDIYPWSEQRKYAEGYDCVVCDCGLVDYPDDDPNSPASLFSRSMVPVLLVSGAPWDLHLSEDLFSKLSPEFISSIRWFVYGAPKEIMIEIAKVAAGKAAGNVTIDYVPFRHRLFAGDSSRYERYERALEPVLEAVRAMREK